MVSSDDWNCQSCSNKNSLFFYICFLHVRPSRPSFCSHSCQGNIAILLATPANTSVRPCVKSWIIRESHGAPQLVRLTLLLYNSAGPGPLGPLGPLIEIQCQLLQNKRRGGRRPTRAGRMIRKTPEEPAEHASHR